LWSPTTDAFGGTVRIKFAASAYTTCKTCLANLSATAAGTPSPDRGWLSLGRVGVYGKAAAPTAADGAITAKAPAADGLAGKVRDERE
jgi:hypothetical protein